MHTHTIYGAGYGGHMPQNADVPRRGKGALIPSMHIPMRWDLLASVSLYLSYASPATLQPAMAMQMGYH